MRAYVSVCARVGLLFSQRGSGEEGGGGGRHWGLRSNCENLSEEIRGGFWTITDWKTGRGGLSPVVCKEEKNFSPSSAFFFFLAFSSTDIQSVKLETVKSTLTSPVCGSASLRWTSSSLWVEFNLSNLPCFSVPGTPPCPRTVEERGWPLEFHEGPPLIYQWHQQLTEHLFILTHEYSIYSYFKGTKDISIHMREERHLSFCLCLLSSCISPYLSSPSSPSSCSLPLYTCKT